MANLATARRAALLAQKRGLVDYLHLKVSAEDWHGVMDAAADIREVDARLDELAQELAVPAGRYDIKTDQILRPGMAENGWTTESNS